MKKSILKLLLLVTVLSSSINVINAQYGTGLRKNSAKAIEEVEEADIDEDRIKLPAKFSLNGPKPVSQGGTSKCTAFSSAYWIIGLYNGVSGNMTNFNGCGSPDFLYGMYKKVNSDPGCNEGALMFDENKDVKGIAEILKQYGTTSWNEFPFEDDSINCPAITEALIKKAAKNKIAGYLRLDSKQYNNVQELKAWIYGGYPLWFGCAIDEGFDDPEDKEIIADTLGASGGGHAMTIVGYDDSKNAFKLVNSWGDKWKNDGYAWIDYQYLIRLLNNDGEEATIGVLLPNQNQVPVFRMLSPGSCERANWGNIEIENNTDDEIAVEMSGKNYTNDNAANVDAEEPQRYSSIPAGTIKVKVYNADKSELLKEYSVVVKKCETAKIVVED